MFVGETLMVTGCADRSFEWVAFVTGAPLAGEASALPLAPPAAARGAFAGRCHRSAATHIARPSGQDLTMLGTVGSCDHNFVDCGGGAGDADSEGPTDPDDSATTTAACDGSPGGGRGGGFAAARRPRAASLGRARRC
jgi:hypothetical protein